MENHDPMIAAMQRQLDARFDESVKTMSAAGPSLAPRAGVHTMALDPASVHVNAPLANVLVFFKNRKGIADEVMPVIPVAKQSDVYFVYPADTAFDTAKMDTVGQLGQVAEISLTPSTSPYKTLNHALREWVPTQVLENADSPIQPLAHAEENLARYLMLAREVRVANQVFATGNYGSNTLALTGGSRWDTSTGTPVTDTWSAIQAINVNDELLAVYGEQVWNKLITNPEAKSYITNRPSTEFGATPLLMNDNTWGAAFGLRGVRVGRMKSNSVNDPGNPSYGYVWGKSAAFIHVPESPGIMTTAFAYTFRWGQLEHRVHFDPIRGVAGAYMVQVHHSDAEQIIDSTGATGYLYTTCVS